MVIVQVLDCDISAASLAPYRFYAHPPAPLPGGEDRFLWKRGRGDGDKSLYGIKDNSDICGQVPTL